MWDYNPKLRTEGKASCCILPALMIFILIMLVSCIPGKNEAGVTFIAPRGNPPVQEILWSPTNQNIIMVNANAVMSLSGPAEIYLLDLKTKKKEILVQNPADNPFAANWTFDGGHLILQPAMITPSYDKQGWYIYDINHKSSSYLIDATDPALSPDGKTLAVNYADSIVLINMDTKKEETIFMQEYLNDVSGLGWSPDGQSIIFASNFVSIGHLQPSSLYILNIKSHQAMKITENGRDDELIFYPTWSPKGNIIAFTIHSASRDTLHLVRSDGKCETIIPLAEDAWSPTWSPDGEKLGFVGVDGIYILKPKEALGKDIYQNLCP